MAQKALCSAVVAMAAGQVIGANNQLAWKAPEDLRHFKRLTTGHVVIMGRKTWSSLGRPLPQRVNIVLSQKGIEKHTDVVSFGHIEDVLEYAEEQTEKLGKKEYFVIGGGQIYDLFMPYIQRIHLTYVDLHVDGDTYFSWPKDKFLGHAGRYRSADVHNPALHFLCMDRRGGLPFAPLPTYIQS